MPTASTKMSIDGKWVACHPVDEFGALGVRYLCDLGANHDQPAKRLLLRRRAWPGSYAAKLGVGKCPDGARLGVPPVVAKSYQELVPSEGGKFDADLCEVLQQDATGLVSLGAAVRSVLKKGDARRVWKLFYFACSALDEFGKAPGPGKLVPLQCPQGLAVGPADKIVLLDAEVRVAGTGAADPEMLRVYGQWFGNQRVNGFAQAEEASRLHANALLAYFRQLLGDGQRTTTPAGQALAVQLATDLGKLSPEMDLDDLESWVRDNKEDWSLPVEGEERERGSRRSPVNGEIVSSPPPAPPRKKRSLLLRLSLYLNLLLAVAVLVLWLLWKAQGGTIVLPWDAKRAEEADKLDFSSYCVVFPIQGTIGEKVGASLNDLFPGKVREITPQDRDQLLGKKLGEVVKAVDDPALKGLLAGLANDHSIRFKGFAVDKPDGGLPSVVERGGIFSITKGQDQQYGSLLQANSLDKILKEAGLAGKDDARKLLGGLKKAVAEYASLEDALSIVGKRPAFLVAVEPTEAAHEELRKKLLSRLDKPVFVSRPLTELFNAVDPTADSGGGSAEYTLTLDRRCHWREAGPDDRKNLDYDALSQGDKKRLKWQQFPAGQAITWKPIPLPLKNSKSLPAASFDLAVVLPTKVVVFRNQNILVGDSKAAVVAQGRNYISKGLRLDVPASEDVVSVREQGGQYTGTLFYSLLADQASHNEGVDLQVFMPPQDFDAVRNQDDGL